MYFCLKKIFLQSWFLLVLSVSLMICSMPLVVYADVSDQLPGWDFVDVESGSNAFLVNSDYLIRTGSNADSYGLSTMDFIDDNYGISPASSIGSVTNTINNPITVIGYYTNGEGVFTSLRHVFDLSGDSYSVRILDSELGSQYDGFLLKTVEVWFDKSNLPIPGSYAFSFDFSSDFTMGNVLAASFYSKKLNVNASTQSDYMDIHSGLNLLYGDMYLSPKNISLTSVNNAALVFHFSLADGYRNFAGDFRFNFTPIASGDYPSTAGTDTSQQDYQSGVSNTLNQIDDSLRNLIQHISDQLAALWDQMFNLMHVPTMAKLDQIISAIQNINLDVTVDLDELKSVINKMSNAITGKVDDQIANDNANTDSIVNGYDNSGMASDKDRLDSSIQEYDQVENQLLDPAKEQLENFEFDTDLGEFLGPISDISYFLQGIFLGMGHMNVVVTFSLTLSVALILIGWYRFKGGS